MMRIIAPSFLKNAIDWTRDIRCQVFAYHRYWRWANGGCVVTAWCSPRQGKHEPFTSWNHTHLPPWKPSSGSIIYGKFILEATLRPHAAVYSFPGRLSKSTVLRFKSWTRYRRSTVFTIVPNIIQILPDAQRQNPTYLLLTYLSFVPSSELKLREPSI